MGRQGTDTTTTTTRQRSKATGSRRRLGASIIPAEARRPLAGLRYSGELEECRRRVRHQVPICPGVYAWLNDDGNVAYVGKSKSLRHRLTAYFANDTADPKMARIRRRCSTLVWESISHELLALIREQELISQLRPPLNVEGKPERRQPGYACISRGVAPSIFFARQIPGRAADVFGPFAGRGQLSMAIVGLNYAFQLRDCPDRTRMQFNNQLQLFDGPLNAKCLRYELNSCPAPCAAACSREGYLQNVKHARRFLQGRDQTILDQLRRKMKSASDALAFERATVLRDQLNQLAWLSRRIKQLQTARRKLSGVFELPGFDHRQIWLMLDSGILRSVAARPVSIPTGNSANTLFGWRTQAGRNPFPQNHLETNLLIMFSSWMKKRPDYFSARLDWDEAVDQIDRLAATHAVGPARRCA